MKEKLEIRLNLLKNEQKKLNDMTWDIWSFEHRQKQKLIVRTQIALLEEIRDEWL